MYAIRSYYACALFDRAGALIANAPHIPVHLGSMGAIIAIVMLSSRSLAPAGQIAFLLTRGRQA